MCTSCKPDFFMPEDSTGECISRCDRETEYFDLTNKYCAPCMAPTYPDEANQKCQRCSKLCNSCSLNLIDKSETCTKCSEGATLDTTLGKCRTQCNSTSMFNFTTVSCQPCGANGYLDPNDLVCKACPANCTSCEYYQDLGRVACKTCSMGY